MLFVPKTDGCGIHHQRGAFERLLGPEGAKAFWADYRERYIAEDDIRFIRSVGFNTVRIPLHWNLVMAADGTMTGPAGGRRRLSYGDVLVLVRRRGNIFDAVIQALKHLQHATGKTVIFVGVLEKVTDEFNVSTWQPQMEGSKAGRELPGIVDQVISLHLFSRDSEGN